MAEITRKELLLALIGSGDRPRLSGLDLGGLDLAEIDLRGANLRNAKLGGADLSYTAVLNNTAESRLYTSCAT